jgi:predicted nucleic acid-binding protein
VSNIIIDTGPLLAFLDKGEQFHRWAAQKIGQIRDPLLTCVPVITETVFLMQRNGMDTSPLFSFIQRGDLAIQPVFNTPDSRKHIAHIIVKYADLPADFADACLMSLYEATRDARIFTLDSHFTIYRTATGNPPFIITP